MARQLLHSLFTLAALSSVQAFFLVGNRDILVSERLDPIINPGTISGHTHSVFGGSNFGSTLSTESLRNSECTTMPIQEDKSNYWFPHLYFQHKDGSFSSLSVGNVVYYLFNDAEDGKPNTVQAFPDDFRMISGDMTLRSYNASSYAQQAVTFLCLDFNGVTTKYNELPPKSCPSGIRAQINFPMCWDGKNLDSPDHKSHVAFPSGGPDSGTCDDPNYPVTVPRIFVEGYWSTGDFDKIRDTDAMNSTQPYVFAHGDPTGYGYHADFYNGWKSGVLQNVLDKCKCTTAAFGDATCCGDMGVFTLETSGSCGLTPVVDEQVTGNLPALPGNNPVRYGPQAAPALAATSVPAILSPAYAYTGASATATGTVVSSAVGVASATATPTSSASSVGASAASSGSGSASGSSTDTGVASSTPAPGSSSASGSASVFSSSSSGSVSTNAQSSSQAGETSIPPPPAYGASSYGSSTTGDAAVAVPTSSSSGANDASTGSGSSDSSSSEVASATQGSDSSAIASASATQGSESSDIVSATQGSDSAAVASPTQTSESSAIASPAPASASTVSESSAIASPAPASASTVSESSAIASPAPASASTMAASSGYTIMPATPSGVASSSSSSTGSGQNTSSSSGESSDDDDEYEYYCERRPKPGKKHHGHQYHHDTRSFSKARRNHNSHRRLTSDDF